MASRLLDPFSGPLSRLQPTFFPVTPLEQEQILEKTRAQIRQQVAEIGDLARTSRNGVQFFREFISRLVAALGGQGGAVWLPNESGDCQLFAESNFASGAYHENERQRRDVNRVLSEIQRNRRPFIVGALMPDLPPPGPSNVDEIMNVTPYPLFFVPVLTDEKHIGVIVQVWLKAAGDPKNYPALVTFLQSVCAHAATFLKGRGSDAAIARNQEYENMLRFQGEFVGELDPGKIGRGAVNHFTDLFGASRCSLYHLVGGRWRLEHVSNQETIDHRSELVVALCKLATRLPVSDQPQALSLDDPAQAPEWAELLEPLGSRQAAYAFFHGYPHEGQTGLVLLERHAENAPFSSASVQQLGWARGQLGRSLLAATTHREVPFRRVLHPVTRARGLWKRRQRIRLAAWIGVPVLLLLLWLLVPWTLRVDGDCVVEPRRLATVAAETTGKIEKVLVGEGQYVEQGQTLAKLEDDDIQSQLRVTAQDISKWQAEANRYQTLGDDGQRKVAEIERDGSLAKLDRLNFLLKHTTLVAPISGVVLTKNLANLVGESIELGKTFCEIAGRDEYEVDMDLRQQDLGVLLDAMRRTPDLPVDFILHARTDLRLHTTVHGPAAISQTAHVKPGGSFFLVRADFPVDATVAASIKPGYTGKAKIDLGRHPLAAVMMRKFLDYWRVEWGF